MVTVPESEIMTAVLSILKRGNTAEVKRVGGEIHIIEIQRKIKHRATVATGQPDG